MLNQKILNGYLIIIFLKYNFNLFPCFAGGILKFEKTLGFATMSE